MEKRPGSHATERRIANKKTGEKKGEKEESKKERKKGQKSKSETILARVMQPPNAVLAHETKGIPNAPDTPVRLNISGIISI